MNYAAQVLRNEVLIAAIENVFVPVLIYNCPTKGSTPQDQAVLKAFKEPAWNNPVARIITADKEDLIPRLNGVYSSAGVAEKILEALKKAGISLPGKAVETLRAVAEGRPVTAKEAAAFRNAVSNRLERTLDQSLDGAVRAYEAGKYGKAYLAAQRITTRERAGDFEKADAEYLKGVVMARFDSVKQRTAALKTGREYILLFAQVKRAAQRYRGLVGVKAWLAGYSALEKDDTVKAEITALKTLGKLERKLRKAEGKKALEAARHRLQAFADKNQGTRAAEKALALIEP